MPDSPHEILLQDSQFAVKQGLSRSKMFVAVVLLVLSVCAISFGMLGRTLRDRATKPAVTVAPQQAGGLVCELPVFTFGRVDYSTVGGKLTHEFVIRDITAETCMIRDIRSSCGCMVAAVQSNSIAPGESLALKVSVTLPPQAGPFDKRLLLYADEAHQPLSMRVFGEVSGVQLLDVAPRSLNFGKVDRGATKCRWVTLLCYGPIDLGTLSVSSDDPRLHCEVVGGSTGRPSVRVSLESGHLSTGIYSSEVTISVQTEAKGVTIVNVPVSAVVE